MALFKNLAFSRLVTFAPKCPTLNRCIVTPRKIASISTWWSSRKIHAYSTRSSILPLVADPFDSFTWTLQEQNQSISISFSDNPDHSTLILYRWLLDHCTCSFCRNPATFQKKRKSSQIDSSIKPKEVYLVDGQYFNIVWQEKNDGHDHVSSFFIPWIYQYVYLPLLKAKEKKFHVRDDIVLWDKNEITRNIPQIDFHSILKSDQGLLEWLSLIEKYGIAFVTNMPHDIEAANSLAKRIAFPRETHYGRIWNVKPNLEHKDSSYSSEALNAHTDTTYFTDPIGLQLLHVIEKSSIGGSNLFVDGFYIAQQLKKHHPSAYECLSTTYISGIYHDLQLSPITPSPILSHHPITRELIQIRYNNDDRDVIPLKDDIESMKSFYDALSEWQNLIDNESNIFWKMLEPSTAVIFDNFRLLHGRGSFSGNRRFLGFYLGHDDYRGRLKKLRRELHNS